VSRHSVLYTDSQRFAYQKPAFCIPRASVLYTESQRFMALQALFVVECLILQAPQTDSRMADKCITMLRFARRMIATKALFVVKCPILHARQTDSLTIYISTLRIHLHAPYIFSTLRIHLHARQTDSRTADRFTHHIYFRASYTPPRTTDAFK
jgi:hypothetical protein